MSIVVELTENEANIAMGYLFRKCCKLKDSGLEDSDCYVALKSAYDKIRKQVNELERRERLEEIAKSLKRIYADGMKDSRSYGLEDVDDVDVWIDYEKGIVIVTLYDDGCNVGQWSFRDQDGNVVCCEDDLVADMTNVKTFFDVDD